MKNKKSVLKGFALGLVTAFLLSVMVVPGFAATVAKTITVYTGIILYYDGVKVNPKDANGNTVEPLLYNGTTYLPVRAISNLFDEDINWDGSTKSVYIGDMPGLKTYLGVDLEPYSKSDYYDNPTFTMDGKTYMNGFILFGGSGVYKGYAIFNLNGQFDWLEFDIGHVNHVSDEKEIVIYLDGSIAQSISLAPEEMVKHVTIPLNGAMQLKIEGSGSGRIGLANAELS